MTYLTSKCTYETNLKVTTNCLKSVISTIVNENQVAYINNRFTSESNKLISDVLKITNSLDIEGLFNDSRYKKAFDSINHSFLMCLLKKLDLATNFKKRYKSY